mgnify:CR=1 FL=1
MLPTPALAAETNSHHDQEQNRDPVQFSDQAQQLQKNYLESNAKADKKSEKEQGKEFVQVSSSIGRSSRITGLNRDEVAALYRSIDQLS